MEKTRKKLVDKQKTITVQEEITETYSACDVCEKEIIFLGYGDGGAEFDGETVGERYVCNSCIADGVDLLVENKKKNPNDTTK